MPWWSIIVRPVERPDLERTLRLRELTIWTTQPLAHLADINLPTLIYLGDKDNPQGYDSARQAADVMPNATFVSLAGLNHLDGFLESELVLPHAKAFLAGVLASAV